MLNFLPIKNIIKYSLLLLASNFVDVYDSNNNSTSDPYKRNTTECLNALPFCSDQIYTFPNATNTSAPRGINFGCLSSAENPIWYYMQIGQTGPLKLRIQQTTQPNGGGRTLDVDFALWGPFSSYEDGCSSIVNGTSSPIQSSYSPNNIEYIGIGVSGGSNSSCSGGRAIGQSTPTTPQQGEFYIVLLTNYSGESGFITFNQESGAGSANCDIVNPCSISSVTTNATCEGLTTKYEGQIVFTDAPDSGTLTITAENGGSQTFNAPFTSPISYNFTGTSGSTETTSVTVGFSEDTCSKTNNFTVNTYVSPIFNIPTEICFNEQNVVLPNISNNGIRGSWNSVVNNQQNTTYTFTPDAGQCAKVTTHTINIKSIPNVSINSSVNTICTNETFIANLSSTGNSATTYTWDVIGTNVSGATPGSGNKIQQQLATVNPNGGTVKYIVTPHLNGCNGEPKEIVVTVNPKPTAFAPANMTICSGENVIIELNSNHSNTTYSYTVNQNNTSGAINGQGQIINQTVKTNNENIGYVTYYITPKIGNCDGEAITVNVTVNPSKTVNLNSGYICFDDNGNLINSFILNTGLDANYSYVWYKNGTAIPLANNSNYEVIQAGIYYVEVLNLATGCRSTSNNAEILDSFGTHQMEVYVENTLQLGKIEIEMRGNGVYQYQINGSGYNNNAIFNNLLPGDYVVEVKDITGCYYERKLVTIISYPNFFTPNGDGINDTWNIWSLANNIEAEILIFDRKGALIKQITPRGEGWDGTKNGKALPSTDYWFVVKYQDGRNKDWKTFKSHFSLKR